MKQVIFSNWNFIRLLRLIMGVAILVQGVITKDVLFGIAGLLFTGMAVFNLGCCGGTGNCAAPPQKKDTVSKDIYYEEVV